MEFKPGKIPIPDDNDNPFLEIVRYQDTREKNLLKIILDLEKRVSELERKYKN